MNKNIIRNAVMVFILLFLASGSVVAYRSNTYKDNRNIPGNKHLQNNDSGSTVVKRETSVDTVEKDTGPKDGNGTDKPGTAADTGDTGKPGATLEPDVKRATVEPNIKRVKVRGLYLTGWTMGSTAKIKHYIDLANTTEINSFVVDIKDDDGYVGYESNIPAVKEIRAWIKKYDADALLKAFHENNIHVIGRIVCFKDPVLSAKRPDLAVKTSGGKVWRDNHNLTWLNPYNKDSWPYLIEIADEAVQKGFDEIQFDYVRFPNDGDKKSMDFGNGGIKKYEVINEFLSYAGRELPQAILSADVFGIICESPEDTEDIGQYLELAGKDMNYISPMVYPSHYALGQIVNKVKFMKPDLEPYGVVYNSLIKAKDRISGIKDYKAEVRPYLQDFTASWLGKGHYQSYGDYQVRQQIKAVYDAGYDEWILWDASNTYSETALLKED